MARYSPGLVTWLRPAGFAIAGCRSELFEVLALGPLGPVMMAAEWIMLAPSV